MSLTACGGRGIVAEATAPNNPSTPPVTSTPAPTTPSTPSLPTTPPPQPAPNPTPAPAPTPSPAPVPESHYVALSWNASPSSIMGYNVYRGTKHGGPYARINPELEPATVYTDHHVSGGATYYYVVTSVDASAESGYSNEIMAKIPTP